MLSANAVEFEKSYAEMDLIVDASFLQTSWGDYLTHIAETWGIFRRTSVSAVVTLQITGTKNTPIPSGSLFSTEEGINFTTNESVTIGNSGTVSVEATAQNVGESGNVAAGTITKIPVTIYGVSSVINNNDAHDGYNEEDDDTLRARTLAHLKKPAQSGNSNHYIEWAQSVSGVGAVKCILS